MQDQLTPRRADRHDHRDRPRRTSLLIVFLLFTGLVGGVVWVSSYYRGCKGAERAVSGVEAPITFTVEEGATAEQVVNDLHEQGVIPCGGFVGNLLMRGTGKASEIRAGTYGLTTGMSLDAAVEVLTTAPKSVKTVRLTIPPGYRLTQIADRVEQMFGIPASKFVARATSGDFSLTPYLPDGSATVEGFLYPETYRIPAKATADDVIHRLLDQFAIEAEGLPWTNAKDLGVTPYEIVTIASMIEKEAAVQKDRPLIAGVIYNRLADGMQLGIDATVLYADPTPDGELSTSDLETDTPYNTRIRTGLPPTPIASPYAWSLEAALDPAPTDFLYYVLCGADGSHRFALTYAEHLHNVDVCLG
ncbi:MAG: endolytic transglycosylase MltG [Actinomycetota bacterium]